MELKKVDELLGAFQDRPKTLDKYNEYLPEIKNHISNKITLRLERDNDNINIWATADSIKLFEMLSAQRVIISYLTEIKR
jgi:hypothetical protein